MEYKFFVVLLLILVQCFYSIILSKLKLVSLCPFIKNKELNFLFIKREQNKFSLLKYSKIQWVKIV